MTTPIPTPIPITLDFVSDVACPWCAVGLYALEQALGQLQGQVQAQWRMQPFELNPDMPKGGQDLSAYLSQKYGSTPEQQAQMRQAIGQRGAQVGFAFAPGGRGRAYNTFDAHRLLHWAGLPGQPEGAQLALKKAILTAYHGQVLPIEDPAVLLQAVRDAGLPVAPAQAVLDSQDFAAQVRAQQRHFLQMGISSVPATIVNGQHLISGGQSVQVFVQALRQLAAQSVQDAHSTQGSTPA